MACKNSDARSLNGHSLDIVISQNLVPKLPVRNATDHCRLRSVVESQFVESSFKD